MIVTKLILVGCKRGSHMILGFPNRKNSSVNGNISDHVQDHETWRLAQMSVGGNGEYTHGHSGFETPKMPVGYFSKFNSKVTFSMKPCQIFPPPTEINFSFGLTQYFAF